MNEVTRRISFLVSLSKSFDLSFVGSLLRVVWRIIASVNALSRRELSPRSFERFERRLERFFRELARLLIEQTVNHLESSDRPTAIQWDGGRTLVAHRRFWRTMETRLGTIRYQRWVFQHELPWVPSVAPLDLRLGLIGQRVSPGVAHKMGRLRQTCPSNRHCNNFVSSLVLRFRWRLIGELSNTSASRSVFCTIDWPLMSCSGGSPKHAKARENMRFCCWLGVTVCTCQCVRVGKKPAARRLLSMTEIVNGWARCTLVRCHKRIKSR